MPVKGGYLLIAGGGALLIWSGLKGKSFSGSLRDVISGKPLNNSNPVNQISSSAAGAAGNAASTVANSVSAVINQGIGRTLAIPYGWSAGAQWNALVMLWNRESGWSNTAQNPSSGAYGIPQSLPYTKMPKAAWPPSAGGNASSIAQISWGLSYIKSTYGNPVNAWAHETSIGWY